MKQGEKEGKRRKKRETRPMGVGGNRGKKGGNRGKNREKEGKIRWTKRKKGEE